MTDGFCAIQAVADEKGIEADVGCDEEEEAVDPSTLPPVEATEVLIQDFAFDAPHIQVAVGDTVTWTQGTDEEPHTATADDETFDSGVLEEGAISSSHSRRPASSPTSARSTGDAGAGHRTE